MPPAPRKPADHRKPADRRRRTVAKKTRTNRVSFADLSKRVDQPEPLVVEVAPGVELTFEDPFDGDYDVDFTMPDTPREQMQLLLGDEAFEAFDSSDVKLSGRQYVAVIEAVMGHFRLGEGDAS
jgi:hypothetical protein